MAEKVKLTRKDLKGPDEFISFTTRSYDWAHEHYRGIMFFLIGILLVVAVSVILHNRDSGQESQAANILFTAKEKMDESLNIDKDSSRDKYEELKKEAAENFSIVLAKYPKTKAAPFARLYLGKIMYEEKNYKGAEDNYNKALKAFPQKSPARGLVLTNIAYALEASNKTEEACNYFKEAAKLDTTPQRDQVYYSLSMCLAKTGKKQEADKYLKTILSDYPDSRIIEKVNDLLAYGK